MKSDANGDLRSADSESMDGAAVGGGAGEGEAEAAQEDEKLPNLQVLRTPTARDWEGGPDGERKYDRYGFSLSASRVRGAKNVPEAVSKARRDKEAQRLGKWIEMLDNWEDYSSVPSKALTLKKRIRKGVPDEMRGRVWCAISGVGKCKEKHPTKYRDLIALSQNYTPDRDIRETIERDIHRTFPKHVMFEKEGAGQDQLRRVSLLVRVHLFFVFCFLSLSPFSS